jgi:hypothetical protein
VFCEIYVFLQLKAKNVWIMTALELNAQIWRSIAEIADDESLMKQLAKYLKKLAAKKEKDETLVSKEEFMASLDRGEEEYRQGKCVRLLPNESVSEMLRRSGL